MDWDWRLIALILQINDKAKWSASILLKRHLILFFPHAALELLKDSYVCFEKVT